MLFPRDAHAKTYRFLKKYFKFWAKKWRDAECRHNAQSFVQLASALSLGRKLGNSTNSDYVRHMCHFLKIFDVQ